MMDLASHFTGHHYSAHHVARSFAHADRDGSGGIDFQEFTALWHRKDWMRSAVAERAGGDAVELRRRGAGEPAEARRDAERAGGDTTAAPSNAHAYATSVQGKVAGASASSAYTQVDGA